MLQNACEYQNLYYKWLFICRDSQILCLKVNLHKVTEQRLCVHCDVSRRPDVHGVEEALLSAHLAAGLDCPRLEDVL